MSVNFNTSSQISNSDMSLNNDINAGTIFKNTPNANASSGSANSINNMEAVTKLAHQVLGQIMTQVDQIV